MTNLTELLLFLNMILCAVGMTGVVLYRRRFLRCLLSLQTILVAPVVTVGVAADGYGDENGMAAALFFVCLSAIYAVVGLAVFMPYFKKHVSLTDLARGDVQ